MSVYVPDRGDIVWLEFNPQAGSEQAGHRPAIVISPKIYNQKAGLALFCPITSKIKGYPFETAIKTKKINGVILCDQIKSLDWHQRKAKYIEEAPLNIIEDVIAKIKTLIE